MTVIINTADVPAVSGDELYQPMRWLIENGQGLALIKGLGDAELRTLDDAIWANFEGSAEARLAVAIRFRALLEAFGARRLRDALLLRGFKAIRAVIDAAASERLNTRFGFKAQPLVMAIEATVQVRPAIEATPAYAQAA